MTSKQLVSQSLAALLLIGILASCGGEAPANDTTASGDADTTTEAVQTSAFDALPEKDFGGIEFRILMRDNEDFISDMYAEGENGDTMNDAIYQRNRKVEERFNVRFVLSRTSNASIDSDAAKMILAGDDAMDVYLPHGRTAMADAQNKLLVEWTSETMPYTDLDKPWWSQTAREAYSIGNHLYFMNGDFSYRSFAMLKAIYFNKEILDDLQIEHPYQMALDGKWTHDAFEAILKQCASDLNGDSDITPGEDRIPFVTSEWSGPCRCIYSADERIYRKDKNDIPYLSINTERVVDVFQDFFDMIESTGSLVHCSKDKHAFTAVDLFVQNKAVFLEDGLTAAANLRDMEAEFGILPCPKYDESVDKYYSLRGALFVCVPITSKDTERTSLIMEGLSIIGYETVVPTYYEVALQRKYTRDEDSLAMLELIREGEMYDMGFMDENGKMKSVGQQLAIMEDPNFSSFYAANEEICKTNMQKTIDAFLSDK